MEKVETYNRKNIFSQIKWLIKMVRYLLGKETSEGGSIQSIQEGDNISIDNTDPQNPIVSSTGGGDFIPLAGTEVGSPVTGDLEFSSFTSISSYDENSDIYSSIEFRSGSDNEDLRIYSYNNSINENVELLFYPSDIEEYDVLRGIKLKSNGGIGLYGHQEFDKQGNRNAFAQLSDLYDYAIEKPTEGTSGQVLTTDGAGAYTWEDAGGGSTPTLSEVLAKGNVADTSIEVAEYFVLYQYDTDTGAKTGLDFPETGTLNISVSGGIYSTVLYLHEDYFRLGGSFKPLHKGITATTYFGANYDDYTYVQKKYVDDNTMINPTLITGYNAGATQTLKNISGVLTWVTD